MSQEGGDRQLDDGEQRAGERSAIELEVQYERMNSFFYDYTRNISRGGTFVRTDRPLAVGTRFLFKLSIPGLSGPLELTGEVRWIRRQTEAPGGEPGMGIQFIFEDDSERAVIDGVVEKLMTDSLGPLIATRLRATPG
jgi:type IV pilus assembly protein PilZ